MSTQDEVEQLRVQLAGCGVAALGHTSDPANPGDYGWSPSYEDTLKLRLRFDALYEALSEAADKESLPANVRDTFQAVRKNMRSGSGMSAARTVSALMSKVDFNATDLSSKTE